VSSSVVSAVDTAVGFLHRGQRAALRIGRPATTERLVRIEERTWASDLAMSGHVLDAIQAAKWNYRNDSRPPVNWGGVLHMKDPFSLACYPLVIQELRPLSVVELGSYHGGSARWLADLLSIFGLPESEVHSFDIDIDRIRAEHPKVSFHRADVTNTSTFDAQLLRSLPHPWLLIEDTHQNVHSLLMYFDQFLRPGDWLIVEDTDVWQVYREMRDFLLERNGQYLVDTYYTDLYGYNVTWHRNGYLRKVSE
jgi:cephalosporin hydroxylase